MRFLLALAAACAGLVSLPAATKPAKPTDKGKTEKKEKEEPKIPGQVLERGDGTYLSIGLEGANYKLSFYDAEKKQMKPNVARATVRWPNVRGPGDYRTVLNPAADGMALIGAKPVVPPYNFNLYLTLLEGEGDNAKAVGTFVVKFSGVAAGTVVQ